MCIIYYIINSMRVGMIVIYCYFILQFFMVFLVQKMYPVSLVPKITPSLVKFNDMCNTFHKQSNIYFDI